MSFLRDAQIILPAVRGIALTVFGDGNPGEDEFEKYCFSSSLQPLFTREGLRAFFAGREGDGVFLVRDALDVHVIFLSIRGQRIALGPYITAPWKAGEAKLLLAGCGAQADALVPYKRYRCGLPLIPQADAEQMAALLLRNLGAEPCEPVTMDFAAAKAENLQVQIPEAYGNFEQVNRNYTSELLLMDAVREGDAQRALKLLDQQEGLSFADRGIRFLSDTISDRVASTLVFRALVRHAALQAGLTPVFIDGLSQEYAQRMHTTRDEEQLRELMRQYLLAFCQAVRENRRITYSPYVRHAVQYIELHLNRPITAEELCSLNHITRQYFSRQFKKETGMTVKQYIMMVRCDRAAELLENSALPVQEISHYVGYEDTNYFARIFKSVKGMPPQEYRKRRQLYYP